MQVYTEVPLPDEHRNIKSAQGPLQLHITSLASEEEYLSCHATVAPSTATSVSASLTPSRQASNQPSPRQHVSPTDNDTAEVLVMSGVVDPMRKSSHVQKFGTMDNPASSPATPAVKYKLPQHRRRVVDLQL